jgi:hypothetical protein
MGANGVLKNFVYIPGVELSMKSDISAMASQKDDSNYVHVSFNGKTESLMLPKNVTAEEIGIALLSLCGLTLDDMDGSVQLSLWDRDQQILGPLKGNSADTPYTIKLSSGKHFWSHPRLFPNSTDSTLETSCRNHAAIKRHGIKYPIDILGYG